MLIDVKKWFYVFADYNYIVNPKNVASVASSAKVDQNIIPMTSIIALHMGILISFGRCFLPRRIVAAAVSASTIFDMFATIRIHAKGTIPNI